MNERVITSIEGQQVTLTHLERLIYPEVGIVKAEVIKYYLSVAKYLLPHLLSRPLVFNRYPNGVGEDGFYQKNAPAHLPDWIATYQHEQGTNYIVAQNTATLTWLANYGCLEIHPWLSRIGSLPNPDFLVFDLDPSPANTFSQAVKTAMVLKNRLDDLHLVSYPKTSGGRGIHVYIPIYPRYTYRQVRDLAVEIGTHLVNDLPDITTLQRSKAKRGDRIYIDCLQIGEGKTLCAPYSLRPSSHATISVPLQWEELPDISPADFTISNILTRLDKIGDIFYPVLQRQQELDAVLTAFLGNRIY